MPFLLVPFFPLFRSFVGCLVDSGREWIFDKAFSQTIGGGRQQKLHKQGLLCSTQRAEMAG